MGSSTARPAPAMPAARLLGALSLGGLSLTALSLAALLLPAAGRAGDGRTHLFPGSREGGGTRAECASRTVALLVPEDGRFRPAQAGWIGLLEGQSAEPVPLAVRIDGLPERTLPARPAGVRLLRLPALRQPALWESFPRCAAPGSAEAASEGLGEPPPARALLEPGGAGAAAAADRAPDGSAAARAALARLAAACAAGQPSVATAPLLEAFAYGHLAAGLPERLPLHCETL